MQPELSSIDPLDRAILQRFQHNTRLTAAELGGAVGLSKAAVQRRIKHLREVGVIKAEIAQLDAAVLGVGITVIVHVDIDLETRVHIDAFQAAMRAARQVQQCWYTTGQTDFVLVVRVASMAAYEQFVREQLEGRANVARFSSFVALSEVKSGLALAL